MSFSLQVEGERIYHERVATILGNIETEVCICLLKFLLSMFRGSADGTVCHLLQIVSEKQRKEAAPPVAPLNHTSDKTKYFLAEVCQTEHYNV